MSLEISVRLPEELNTESEWVVVPEEPFVPHTLEAAVRDRLAARLSSRLTKVSPVARVERAFEAGVRSLRSWEHGGVVEAPAPIGIQNSCWVGVATSSRLWFTSKRRTADRILRADPSTRLLAFASQTEAEAWCLGFGHASLPERR